MPNSWPTGPISQAEADRQLAEARQRLAETKAAAKVRQEQRRQSDPAGAIPVFGEADRERLKLPPFQHALALVDGLMAAHGASGHSPDVVVFEEHVVDVPNDVLKEINRSSKARPSSLGFIRFKGDQLPSLQDLPKALGARPTVAKTVAQASRVATLQISGAGLSLDVGDGDLEFVEVNHIQTVRVEASGRFLVMRDGGKDPYCFRTNDGLDIALEVLVLCAEKMGCLESLQEELTRKILS